MDVYQLVGLESREYTQNGVQKSYNGLHLVSMSGGARGVEGSAVQKVTCPRNVNPSRLKVGEWYELRYVIVDTRDGKKAYLDDLIPYEGD